jgi:hypothetical protein
MKEALMKAALIILAVSLFWTANAFAQDAPKLLVDRAPEARPEILILGSAHLHNPGRDAVNVTVDDVLAPARQAQLIALVDQLALYKPTHVAVEHVAVEQDKLDIMYQGYLDGTRALDRPEDEQIGMRLAAKLGLKRVYAVDWNGMPPGDFANYRYAEFAKANGMEDRLKALLNPKRIPFPPIASTDLVTWYLAANRPEAIAASHRIYFDIAMFGDRDRQPGADWVGGWYARNLKIFANLVNITDNPSDRIFVVYGAAHAHYLRQFAQESGAFRLRDVSEFVKPAAK